MADTHACRRLFEEAQHPLPEPIRRLLGGHA
jgi:hypothetical protein